MSDATGDTTGWLVHHAGSLVTGDRAVLPVGSIAARYGVSVFEGIRVYLRDDGTTAPWLLDEHVARMRNSCRLMDLDPRVCDRVPEIIAELLAVNRVGEDSYVRAAASAANAGGIGDPAETTLTVSVTPAGRKKWLATGAGMRLAISDWQRPAEAVFPSAAKNISAYAGPRLALAQARRAGYDSCLLRTAGGLISEAPTATLVLVEKGRLVTPRIGDGVLPGVTRAWVLATATAIGREAVEEAVTPERALAADEAFLCGTGLEFGPVMEIGDRRLPGWPACPVTTELTEAYFTQAREGAAVPVALAAGRTT